jgi:hypothetical protein
VTTPAKRTGRTLAFVDLDDTLFSSVRKQDCDGADLVPAALLRSGDVVSYSSPAQRALLRMLQTADQIIPVTARNIDAYRRVLIGFDGPAVVSHGATIMCADGSIDPQWQVRAAPALKAAEHDLKRLLAHLQERVANSGLQPRLVFDGELPVYLVVKHARGDAGEVATLARTVVTDWVGQRGDYTLHLNGNNLAVIPPGVGKAAAVSFLLARECAEHGTPFTIGAGDSLTDLEFLQLCDVAMVPGRSQLSQALSIVAQDLASGVVPHAFEPPPSLAGAREN